MNDTISFNEELMKMLQETEEENNIETCLISGEILEESHIKLDCNHKFNYKYIYNEVHKQKTQPWHSEVNKVGNKQLKCPYCRNIQTGLLPFRDGYCKVKYVNWPPSLMMFPDECSYTFASGKRKGLICSKKCSGKYCLSHTKIMEKREKKRLEKEKKKLEKEKKKLEKEKKKLEQHKKYGKISTNMEGLADHLLQKMEKQLNELSPAMVNLVLSTPNTSITPHASNATELANVQTEQIMSITKPIVVTCAYKFKKGKNKGERCQCKKIQQDGLCKFHYRKHKQAMEKKKAKLENINKNIKIKTVTYNANQNLVITI